MFSQEIDAQSIVHTAGSEHEMQGAHDVQIVTSTINSATHHNPETIEVLQAILNDVSDYERIQQDTLSKATPGACAWLLESGRFYLFLDINSHAILFLWGIGMLGTGKTVMASMVIHRLQALARSSDNQICIAYVYFRYTDSDQITIRHILGSFVKQTLKRHPDCAELAQRALESHIREGTRPTEEELYQLLRQFIQQKKATFYVLDALDEAHERIRLKLLQRLSSLGARLFITSRPLQPLQAMLPEAHVFLVAAEGHDLDCHINQKIASSEYLQRLLAAAEPGLGQELASIVKKKSGGMFLHATMQLDALQECRTTHSLRQSLESFPARIEDVYIQTWARIMSSDKASLARAAIEWVINTHRSLTIDELRHALATNPTSYHFEPTRLLSRSAILTVCCGLIVVDEESELVRLIHYTAKESLNALLLVKDPHPHSRLAAVCVNLLVDRGFQRTASTELSELQSALKGEPLLDYAYTAWAFHSHQSLDSDLTIRVVSAFVAGCWAFPLSLGPNRDSDGDIVTPLHVAAAYDLPLALAGPFDAGAVNVLSTRKKLTPLHLSSLRGHNARTEELLSLPDIEVNLVDGDGHTALMLACKYSHGGAALLLLAHPDSQVNLVNVNGQTALMLASRGGNEGIVKLLLAHPGIDVNLSDSDQQTALMLASRGGNEGIVKLLLAHPDLDVNLSDSDQQTALMLASTFDHKGVIELLLAHPDIQGQFHESLAPSHHTNFIIVFGAQSAKQPLLQAIIQSGGRHQTTAVRDGVAVHALCVNDTMDIMVADLPAFEDDNVERNLLTCKTLFNFFQGHDLRTCSGVIVAHDISSHRLRHWDLLNFRLVEDMCGPKFPREKMAFITTGWLVPESNPVFLESREADLQERNDCFKPSLRGGASCHRHGHSGSSPMSEILRALTARPSAPMAIQEEAAATLPFARTRIGQNFGKRLSEHRDLAQTRSKSLALELGGVEDDWDAFPGGERAAMQRESKALQQTFERLSKIIEEHFGLMRLS